MRLRAVGVFVLVAVRSRLSWLAVLALAAGALTAGPGAARRSAPLSFTALSHSAGIGGHYCALTNIGGVVCWGKNDNGEVGNGTRGDRYRPVAVVGLDHGVKQVSAGGAHTCALMVSGTVKCWGKNFSGQLGIGTNKDSYTPVSVVGLSGVRQITTGDFHSCALLSSGTVKCWGGNENGELGDGDSGRKNNRNRPVNSVSLGSGVAAVDASLIGNPVAQASEDDYTCVVTTAATARCLGGSGSVQPVVEIDATTVCVLTRAGAVECDGNAVPGLESGVKQINQGCAVTTAGAVRCWLPKSAGQHGFDVGIESGAKEVAGSCALMASGWIRCWGCGEEGSLGNGQKRACVGAPVNVLTPISPSGAGSGHGAGPTPATAGPFTLTLSAPSPQPLLSVKALIVNAHCNRACTLTATAIARIAGGAYATSLVPAAASLNDAGSYPLTLRLTTFDRTFLPRSMKPGERGFATVIVIAHDHAAHTLSRQRIVSFLSSPAGTTTSGGTTRTSRQLRSYTANLENLLNGLARGRQRLKVALAGAFNCTLSYTAAATDVLGVIDNRSIISNQLRALLTHPPTGQAGVLGGRLQNAVGFSIAADTAYRVWLDTLAQTHAGCPPPHTGAFVDAGKQDVNATAAKTLFLSAFNPLARSFGLRTWTVNEI
jgi:hypothetical protein